MKIVINSVLGFLVLIALSCSTYSHIKPNSPFDLGSPTINLKLPPILNEISGITTVNDTVIACIQDELGILFLYNIKQNTIVSQDSFFVKGDYEGIAKVNNDIYVLESNGLLIHIKNALTKNKEVITYSTGIPAKNNEGLCYDESNNRLLIACKSKSGKGDELKDKRMIYGFDLNTKTLNKQPLYEIDLQQIKTHLVENSITKDTIQISKLKLKPSAISLDPQTGKLHVLSAASYLYCVYNKGVLEYAEELDPLLFNKAEGICFMPNGDLLISNEGKENPATLLKFVRTKKNLN